MCFLEGGSSNFRDFLIFRDFPFSCFGWRTSNLQQVEVILFVCRRLGLESCNLDEYQQGRACRACRGGNPGVSDAQRSDGCHLERPG